MFLFFSDNENMRWYFDCIEREGDRLNEVGYVKFWDNEQHTEKPEDKYL